MPVPPQLKKILPIAFAVVMMIVTIVAINHYLGTQRHALEQERRKIMANYQEPINVAAAAVDLPAGTILQMSHIRKATVPEKFVQPYAARSPNEVIGRTTVAPIAEGEQILTNKLRRADEVPEGSTLSSVMPKGRRGVTILVDTLTGVGGFVRPGDAVDVLWTVALPAAEGQPGSQGFTLTLFQDIPVLAIGAEMRPGMAPAGATGEETASAAQHTNTVTLGLTPQETSFLLFARQQGQIQLSLRPHQEGGAVAVAPANIQTLMESALGPQAVAQKPKAPHQVEVYKGLQRDVVSLPEAQ